MDKISSNMASQMLFTLLFWMKLKSLFYSKLPILFGFRLCGEFLASLRNAFMNKVYSVHREIRDYVRNDFWSGIIEAVGLPVTDEIKVPLLRPVTNVVWNQVMLPVRNETKEYYYHE